MSGRCVAAICAATVAATPAYAQARRPELSPAQQLILRTLDSNADQLISCQELATFLNPVVVARLRDLGIEPKTAKDVPACGSRLTPAPATDDDDGRSADENYEEYF